MPDRRILLPRALELFRVREELLDFANGIARRRLLDVAALVDRDLRQQPIRDDGARVGFRDVLVGDEVVAVLDQEPRGALL
jgi:pyrimidine operon attenuation protein/uracil phosphoribosyltransferase